MRSKSSIVILDVVLILIFLGSLMHVPIESQYLDGTADLSHVVRKVQDLSKQANCLSSSQFQEAFQAAVQAIRITAGLTTVITGHSGTKDTTETDVVVCLRIPYLLSQTTHLSGTMTCRSVKVSSQLMVDTSVFLTLDTPPPIVG